MRILKLNKYNIDGLTLLELIIVITIIAILAGTITPIYYNVTNSKLAEYTKDEMERIKTALIEFYRDCDQFPRDSGNVTTDFLDLETQPTSARFYGSASLRNWRRSQWNGPYIQDKFNDNGYMRDAWNNNYIYNYTYGDNYCEIISYGPDRVSGGGDDITVRADIVSVREDKIERVKDELDIIQKALNDYIKATGSAPSSIDDLFEWEVLNLPMNESAWTGGTDEVKDYSGNGKHGTARGGANTTTGKVGRCGYFDGINDYVYLPSVNPTTKITVEAWVKSASSSGYSGVWQIVSKYSAYILGTTGTGNKRMAFIIHNGTNWYDYSNYYEVSDPDSWHHFVGTYDSSTNEEKLYVDGILKSTKTVSGTIRADTGPIHIAHRECCAGWYFNGYVDEVRIYSIVLSAEEIYRHYKNPGYPKDYFDLHDKAFKYDEWESQYALGSTVVNGNTVYYFYSYGPDRADDSGGDDDIKPRGL